MSDISYDVEALKEGIKKAYQNIGIFEDAIEKEHNTIKEYRRMIKVIENKATAPKVIRIDGGSLNDGPK
jgi:hypothetical protein